MLELRPTRPGWVEIPLAGTPLAADLARGYREVKGRRYRVFAASAWQLGFVRTISAVEEAEDPRDRRVIIPHDHVSVSSSYGRALLMSSLWIARAAYGMNDVVGLEVHGEPYDLGRHPNAHVIHLWRPRA